MDCLFSFWKQGLLNVQSYLRMPRLRVAEESSSAFSKNSLFGLYFSHRPKFLFQCKRFSK